MYRVTWHKDWADKGILLHSPYTDGPKVEGNITKPINASDGFIFTMNDIEVAEMLKPFKGNVRVFNTRTNEYDFEGRIYKIEKGTDYTGVPYFKPTCEGLLGYLHDMPVGNYKGTRKISEWFDIIMNAYNTLVRSNPEKQMEIGEFTLSNRDEEVYFEIYRGDSVYDTLVNGLVPEVGGEIQVRRVGEKLYLDWKDTIGRTTFTPISMGSNLLNNKIVKDSESLYTIIMPLGAYVEGSSTTRIGIESVTESGTSFLDNKPMQAEFGTVFKVVIFDNVTDPQEILRLGQAHIDNNENLVSINQYTLNTLDLSLIDKNFDSFQIGDFVILNDRPLLEVNEVLRVVYMEIDINNPEANQLTIGDRITDLNEFQADRARLEDLRNKRTERRLRELDIKNESQDASIATNANAIQTNANTIRINRESFDSFVDHFNGDFLDRFNLLIQDVNNLKNNNPGGGGNSGGTDSNGYSNSRVFPVDYNLAGINFWTRSTQPDMSYGERWGTLHSGWDIGSNGNAGYGIYATTDGVVRFSGTKTGGIGNCIYIEHTADGYWSNYMHLASMSVSVGQTVKAGDRIGTMGNSGGDYAIHLHYELSPDGVFHSGGNTVNPQAYLGITGDNTTTLPRPV